MATWQDDERAALAIAVANLRHAYGQPNLDRGIADGLIAPEIQRLEHVIDAIDAHHDQVARLVDDAKAARVALEDQLRRAEAALRAVMVALGPAANDAPECAGCASEISAALAAVEAYGITYRARIVGNAPWRMS